MVEGIAIIPIPQTINHGATKAFTVTTNTGYTKNTTVTGTCPQGTWNGNAWTTGAITAACTVNFSFIPLYTVTPTVDNNGTINPATAQTIIQGSTTTFTLTPNTGYSKNLTVTGTCPQGTWNGNTWTTGPITANCTVNFTFNPNTYTITPTTGTGGTLNPNTPQTVAYGTTKTFTLTPNTGYSKNTTVTGTCPQGTWSGNAWSTGPITADCTVAFKFLCQLCLPNLDGWRAALPILEQLATTRRTNMMVHKVTPMLTTIGGSINPNTMRLVVTGTKASCTITPDAGYTGFAFDTCGGNTVISDKAAFTYTTKPIAKNCFIMVNLVQVLRKSQIAATPALLPSTAGDGTTIEPIYVSPPVDPTVIYPQANIPSLAAEEYQLDISIPINLDLTKLDATGHDLPAEAEDYTCLRDNATGLIWESKTQDGGLQDQNWSYTWYDANKPGGHTGTASGGTCYTVGRCDSEKYTHDINARALCGGKDWRLPTIAELATIAGSALTQYQPPTWAAFEANMVDGYNAMVVDFATGHIDPQPRSVGNAIMLVR